MRVSHGVSAVFDDPNLVSCAGLVPTRALAERCGLHQLVAYEPDLGRRDEALTTAEEAVDIEIRRRLDQASQALRGPARGSLEDPDPGVDPN